MRLHQGLERLRIGHFRHKIGAINVMMSTQAIQEAILQHIPIFQGIIEEFRIFRATTTLTHLISRKDHMYLLLLTLSIIQLQRGTIQYASFSLQSL